jgi:hypothetical protein
MTLQPRERFRNSPAGKFHIDLVTKPEFHHALEIALVQMQYDEGAPAEPALAAASWHRLAGARAFSYVLLNLAEPPAKPHSAPTQNLTHTV